MSSPSAHRGGRYLYAIVPHLERMPVLPGGIDDAPVRLLGDGEVSAVVSNTALARVRPERRHLGAHHAVVRSLMEAGTVLPVAFGTVATSENALLKMLKRHKGSLAGQLTRLAGQAEMGVRVAFAVTNIFEHLVGLSAELKAARDALAARGGAATRDEKIELGSLVERVLNAERERYAAQIEAALAPCCRDRLRKPPRSDTEVVNLACLVPREGLDRFEAALTALAGRLDDSLVLSYSGPWPPHHFVNLNLSL